MASHNRSSLLHFLLISWICLFSVIEASSSKEHGITLNLTHRDSPLSPFYDPSETHFERLWKSLNRSFSRKSSLTTTNVNSTQTVSDAFQAPLAPNLSEYLMKIRIGTPPVDVIGYADTGSDLTWTQCQPCDCYPQNNPRFDPTATTTYNSVSCESEACSAVGQARCDSSTNNCIYRISYGGGQSYSMGDLAYETFTFGSDSGESISFPQVVFGCGRENRGTFDKATSGIIGLGGGALSIIKQLGTSIGGRFSYCLTDPYSQISSKIKFGTNVVVSGPGVVSTPITRKSPDTFYYLTLEGISVSNKRIESTKALVDEGNIVIDSGTTLTYLPRDLYDGLESELVNTIQGTRTDSRGQFNLCYEVPSNGEFNQPPLVAHFRGADVVIPQGSAFDEVEQGVVCLTFVPSDGVALFGNRHQRDYEVGYDLQGLSVSFRPTDCSKS